MTAPLKRGAKPKAAHLRRVVRVSCHLTESEAAAWHAVCDEADRAAVVRGMVLEWTRRRAALVMP